MKTKHIILTLASLIALSACGSDDSIPPENIGKTTQALNAVTTYVQNMQTNGVGPVGWWRLNENPATGMAADSSGRNHPGTYNGGSATTSVLGSTVSDSTDRAVQFSNTGAFSYVNVPDNDDLSLVKTEDNFGNRVLGLSSTWGTSSDGKIWGSSLIPILNKYSVAAGGYALITEDQASNYSQLLVSGPNRANLDMKIRSGWQQIPSPYATVFALQARVVSNNISNGYRAEVVAGATGTDLNLYITKVISGVRYVLAGPAYIGNSTPGLWRGLRFQVNGSTLNAKAWADGSGNEPTTWLTATDTTYPNAGAFGVFSVNSSASGWSPNVVGFDDFRVQSVGMTVHTRFKPSTLTFTGATEGICNGNTGTIANYVPILNKMGADDEWLFRFYPDTAFDSTLCNEHRVNRLSAYMFKQAGGQGSGSFCQPFAINPSNVCKDSSGAAILSTPTNTLDTNTWHSMLAVYEPGDLADTLARSHLFIDGKEEVSNSIPPQRYSNSTYAVLPHNGIAPFRIGGAGTPTTQFRGSLDEVMIFDRMLSATEISGLHNSFTSP